MRKLLIISLLTILFSSIFICTAIADYPTYVTRDKILERVQYDKIKYQWTEPIVHDLMTGKIKDLSSIAPLIGAKRFDNVSAANITLPHTPSPFIYKNTNNINPNSIFAMNMQSMDDQRAQYICFGGDDKSSYGGEVSFYTSNISLLCTDSREIQVAHVWSNYNVTINGTEQVNGSENAVALGHSGTNNIVVGFRNEQTCPPGWNYNNGGQTIPGIANDTFNIGVRPNYNTGERTYSSVYYWVWDVTTNQYWDYNTSILPIEEYFHTTDYALEGFDNGQMNNNDKIAYNFRSLDQYYNFLDLPSNYDYTSYSSEVYTLSHDMTFDGTGTIGLIDLRWEPLWNGYHYEKLHCIPGSQDGVLTNYQVQFVIHKMTGIDTDRDIYLDTCPNGGSLCWPNDFRFTNADNELLSYWIESYNTTAATVWVKVDSIAASPATTPIKVYYGKAGDPGASDGNATFEVFDHFNGTSLDSNKWVQWGTGTNTVSNSNLRLSATGQNSVMAHCLNNITLSRYVIETKGTVISPYNYQGSKYRPGILFRQGASQGGGAVGFDTYAFDRDGWTVFDWGSWSWYDLSSPASISPGDSYGGAFRLQVTIDGSSYTCREAFRNKVINDNRGPTGSYFSLLAEKCADDYDWVFVRKYTPNEPIQSMGMLGVPAASEDMQINVFVDKSHNKTSSVNRTELDP